MTFVQPFDLMTIFVTTFFFSLFIGQKQKRERENGRERLSNEYERESCHKWLSNYHFSNAKFV